jgi:hypothetical protein
MLSASTTAGALRIARLAYHAQDQLHRGAQHREPYGRTQLAWRSGNQSSSPWAGTWAYIEGDEFHTGAWVAIEERRRKQHLLACLTKPVFKHVVRFRFRI